MTLTLKSRTEITVPKSVRRKAGLLPGDQIEFRVSGRTITIAPKPAASADDQTPVERRLIDRGIAASEKDYREGRSYGPFSNHEQFIGALRSEAGKLRRKRK